MRLNNPLWRSVFTGLTQARKGSVGKFLKMFDKVFVGTARCVSEAKAIVWRFLEVLMLLPAVVTEEIARNETTGGRGNDNVSFQCKLIALFKVNNVTLI